MFYSQPRDRGPGDGGILQDLSITHRSVWSRAGRAAPTASFAFFSALLFVLRIYVFCLGDPIQVALEILFQLLLLPKLLEVSACFSLLSFL